MDSTRSDLIVKVVGLEKTFKDFWKRPQSKVLFGLDFEVRKGEIFGLLGPNGAGKSTTIKLLLGLLKADKGDIRIFSKLPDDSSVKHRLGYLPEDNVLSPQLTAEETLLYFGSLFSLNRTVCKERTAQLLEMVGLSHAKDRKVGTFSKGMARRIGIAQALINDPDLIILDEPTSGLDPIGCREIKDLIQFLGQQGKTVIMSSHLLSDVQDICDYTMIIYGGKVKRKGKMSDLLRKNELTTITFPTPAESELKEIIGTLPQEELTVSNPTQSLEDLFLEVVETASREDESSGARAGSGAADYLVQKKMLDQYLKKEIKPLVVEEVEIISSEALVNLLTKEEKKTECVEVQPVKDHSEIHNHLKGLIK